MDPNAAWQQMVSALQRFDFETAGEYAAALQGWLAGGGFAPRGVNGDIALNIARVLNGCIPTVWKSDIKKIIADVAAAQELFGDDELEIHAAKMRKYTAVGDYRRCQPCATYGDHGRCQRRTTLGTQPGSQQDFCGCSCPQATVHRDACLESERKTRGY